MFAALLGQGLDAQSAARVGTYVHGHAGDLARDRLGERGMVAGDLAECLPEAFRDCSM